MSDSTTPTHGPALMRALHLNQQSQQREADAARLRARILSPAGLDPAKLSPHAQRIVDRLAKGDTPAVDGLVEILSVTRTEAQTTALDRATDALAQCGSPEQQRFTKGLTLDVAETIEGHGYDPFDRRQFVELQQHLIHLAHDPDGACTRGPRR